MQVLFAAPASMWDRWSPPLKAACPEMTLVREGAPAEIDAIIYAPGGEIEDLTPYHNARLVQSLWAGVERIICNPTLTQPLARMVDPGLAQGMAEFCTGWAMRAHLGMDGYLQDGIWRHGQVPPLATERHVTILGTGELGRAAGLMLSGIGFRVTGWSASGRPVEGMEVLSGEQLDEALSRAEILISLLPDTSATCDLLNAESLGRLPRGAWLINPGRGTVLNDEGLIETLDSGHLGHAVLDVFRAEPLPSDHPFWAHSGVTVTPHIAAETRSSTAALVVAENLRRAMRGEQVLHLVDRTKGY